MHRAIKDKELMFPEELRQALPKSKREYVENINFQRFKEVVVKKKESPAKEIQVEE